MRLFRRKQKIVDERIVSMQNKIYKEIYVLVVVICGLSMAGKIYFHGLDNRLILTEALILVVTALYYGIRGISLGVYSDEMEIHDRTSKVSMSMKNILIGTGLGVAIALFFGVRNALLYGDESSRLYYFFLVFFASLMIYCPLSVAAMAIPHLIAKRMSKKVNNGQDE